MYRIFLIPILILVIMPNAFSEALIQKGTCELSGTMSLSIEYYPMYGFEMVIKGSPSLNYYFYDDIFIGPDLNVGYGKNRHAQSIDFDGGLQIGKVIALADNLGFYFGSGYTYGNHHYDSDDWSSYDYDYHNVFAFTGLKILISKSLTINIQPEYNYEMHWIEDDFFAFKKFVLSFGFSGMF